MICLNFLKNEKLEKNSKWYLINVFKNISFSKGIVNENFKKMWLVKV
jgi:hypothetical protein